ncbi:Nucleolar protein 9 [Marasmius crinis-equi]|uniref:Nucleolar protein 9 n=1 Tax=Marasmius crinis-equi TaxID=585013 RepID=A0ABR3G0B3_9AGAR
MPRENRKRGKRSKKPKEEEEIPNVREEDQPNQEYSEAGPSWIVSRPQQTEELNSEAPFGYVDADVKAYFRTVDTQIRNWQDGGENEEAATDENADPNAERQMFFVAALTEMTGKEKQLATDPDCSMVLERMAYSMDDFVRRVFLDSLSGSYDLLVRHRFASHVCQTLLFVSAETVSRELNGVFPTVPDSADGELRTMNKLVLDICEELLPSLNSLMMDPFASHVVRVLLYLLCPAAFPATGFQPNLRSKKSSAWKSKQGTLSSLFSDSKGKTSEVRLTKTPPEFEGMARKFIETIRRDLGGNEVRALAASDVAGPCLTILLHIETANDMSDEEDSLMDRMTVGVVSESLKDTPEDVQPSDYLGTLFRDPTSSHVLETIMTRVSEKPFSLLWNAYLKGKLPRLSIHPVANYVVAKSLERCSPHQLEAACQELEESWEKIITSARTSVLRAVIQRSADLSAFEDKAVHALSKAFCLSTPEEKLLLVPCALRLKTVKDYRRSLLKNEEKGAEKTDKGGAKKEATVQGSLLLQTALKLSAPHNECIVNSLNSLETPERLNVAYDPSGSRVMDALLDSSNVSSKAKRSFIMSFMGHFHELVDDRIGSRVGDRCFAFADTYLKEKIARSVIPHEQALIGSFYGKFFSRNLNLYLLRRRPDEWRSMQSSTKQEKDTPLPQGSTKPKDEPQPPAVPEKKRKRKPAPADEIDDVFAKAPVKKLKGPGLSHNKDPDPPKVSEADPSLADVFNAIKAAPKNDGKDKSKKRKK